MDSPQGELYEEICVQQYESVFTGDDLSWLSTLLDLVTENSGTNAPLTSISPLTSLPVPLPTHNIPVTSFTLAPLNQSTTDSSAFFKALAPLS